MVTPEVLCLFSDARVRRRMGDGPHLFPWYSLIEQKYPPRSPITNLPESFKPTPAK